jgi:hypothetical protein
VRRFMAEKLMDEERVASQGRAEARGIRGRGMNRACKSR